MTAMTSTVKQLALALSVTILAGCAVNPADRASSADDNAMAWLGAGDAAYESEDWTLAEQKYRALTERFPNDPYAFFRLGNALVQQARYDEAAQAYRDATRRDPRFAKAHSNLATVYLIQANAAAGLALASLPSQDPAAALLTLRQREIEKIVGIPVDESKGSGRVLRLNGTTE